MTEERIYKLAYNAQKRIWTEFYDMVQANPNDEYATEKERKAWHAMEEMQAMAKEKGFNFE